MFSVLTHEESLDNHVNIIALNISRLGEPGHEFPQRMLPPISNLPASTNISSMALSNDS